MKERARVRFEEYNSNEDQNYKEHVEYGDEQGGQFNDDHEDDENGEGLQHASCDDEDSSESEETTESNTGADGSICGAICLLFTFSLIAVTVVLCWQRFDEWFPFLFPPDSSSAPSLQPSLPPSAMPTSQPSLPPSAMPTEVPSAYPTAVHSAYPTSSTPTERPSHLSSNEPSRSSMPSPRPSRSYSPTAQASMHPSINLDLDNVALNQGAVGVYGYNAAPWTPYYCQRSKAPMAVNGVIEDALPTMICPHLGDTTYEAFWQVDLKNVYRIHRIFIYNRVNERSKVVGYTTYILSDLNEIVWSHAINERSSLTPKIHVLDKLIVKAGNKNGILGKTVKIVLERGNNALTEENSRLSSLKLAEVQIFAPVYD